MVCKHVSPRAHEGNVKRYFLVSLHTSSNQDRELQKEAVLCNTDRKSAATTTRFTAASVIPAGKDSNQTEAIK